ncbi:NAD(P)-binding protein [Eremomyces bilateralis CBS 781.70]|uniref:NAD(P)-binding protein n=1 Tax=Eremomyces bilateralis CBS 781.70 TaxID=1392243 RepID=A0A6G1G6E6_9PEZI|nr:NAD(P)-binding protein [Eremomyces bilateralis CBS 781.70]KAF1813592.1 NAD(P)-binding protein [Eremomyces bilateralis CBS 781.70]
MSTTNEYAPFNLTKSIRQSPPLDFSIPYSESWLSGKHILITGGASGFGEGFARRWAAAGASIVVGDINEKLGTSTVASIRLETKNENVWFVKCDVCDWDAQVQMFKEAVRLSPHKGIDVVVANAGIAGTDPMQMPVVRNGEVQKPNLKILEVDLIGVMYTSHLAFHYLPNNPGSLDCSVNANPENASFKRDRLLLLTGSVASLGPIANQPQYGTAKHGVLGLFRCLRGSSFVQGVRVNLLCPYFIETPIVPAEARLLMAGAAYGKVEDVVEAATRLTADSRILGRSVVIGPKVRVKQEDSGDWKFVGFGPGEGGEEKAIWEAYAEDWEDSEVFTRRMVVLLNIVQKARGWLGALSDIVKVFAGR